MNISQLASDHTALVICLFFAFAVIALALFGYVAVLSITNGKRRSKKKGKSPEETYSEMVKSLKPW